MLPSNLPTVITYLVGNYENTLHHSNPQTVTFRNVTLPSSRNTIKRHLGTDMPPKRKAGHSKIAQKSPANRLFSPWRFRTSRACDKSAQRARKRERRGVCILPYETRMKLIIILEDCPNGKHSNEGQPQRRISKVSKVTSNKSNICIFEYEVENK